MLHSRQRENERRSEELDEKLNRAHDEVDELRRKHERIDRINWDQKRQLEDYAKKDER
jgi:hypothetical protein